MGNPAVQQSCYAHELNWCGIVTLAAVFAQVVPSVSCTQRSGVAWATLQFTVLEVNQFCLIQSE